LVGDATVKKMLVKMVRKGKGFSKKKKEKEKKKRFEKETPNLLEML